MSEAARLLAESRPPYVATAAHALPPGARLLHDGEQIGAAVARMAAEIRVACAGEELTVVCVLHGGLILAADLIRRLDLPIHLGVVLARSYRGSDTQPGTLELVCPAELPLADRHVLVVDDILDTGRTAARILADFSAARPRSLRLATLLDKPSRRAVPIEADFTGFTVPDVFVVGYGLDWNERYRNLPDLVALPPDMPA